MLRIDSVEKLSDGAMLYGRCDMSGSMKRAVGAGIVAGISCMVAVSAATGTRPALAGVDMKDSSGDGLREEERQCSSSRLKSETTVAFEGVGGSALADLVEFRSTDEADFVHLRPGTNVSREG